MKKCLNILMAFLMVAALGGCSQKAESKTYTSTQQGFGGKVVVTLTMEGDKITKVEVEGNEETEGIGSKAIEELPSKIVEANGVDVDVVSGATVTSNAILAGVQDCLNQASGKEISDVKMKAGTYTASAWGFSKAYQLNVEVVVSEDKIESIAVTDNGETAPILDNVKELLIPRMLEHQSVKVDSITGATTSSNAIKMAVEDCLKQAIKANGQDESLVSKFYTVPEKKTDVVTLDTDILVVGLGGSGVASALSAAEAMYEKNGQDASKVSVLGIDKAGKYGGTSAVTTSPMTINPSYFVERNNGENYVDADVLKNAWMEYTEGDSKEWAIDVMMEQSGPAIDWLIENGFEFGEPAQGLSEPYKVCVNYGGVFGDSKGLTAEYFKKAMAKYEEYGGKYMLETEATELLKDEEGKIVGVKAVNQDGTTYTINAKAVILATGGFGGNGEMQDKYLSDEYYPLNGGTYNIYGMAQNDGKMIQSAIDLGAGTYNIGMPPMSHIGGAYSIMHVYEDIVLDGTYDIWTGKEMTQSLNDVPMMMAIAPNSLAVNRYGKRFTDETMLGSYGNWQAGPYFYTLWSNEMVQDIKNNGFHFSTLGLFINQGGWPIETPIENIEEILAEAEKLGIVVKADSIEELAEKLEIDPEVLTQTVSDYNTYCDTKENPADGIVKSEVIYDLSGNPVESNASTFQKVEGNGPYYAVKGSPWIYSTVGALDINENFEVLDKNGEVMEGLYAVGTDSMGVLFTEKKEYVPYGGAAQGWAYTSGYLAGPIAVEKISE